MVDERSDRRPHMCVDGEKQAVVLAGIAEPLKAGHRGQWIHAKAAVIGRHKQTLNAEVAALFPRVLVENPIAVVLDHIVVELLGSETADCVQKLSLLVRPREVH